jgi:hypothetical protein
MKKQIGLIALTALIVSFMAFSGVASAQASNVQVLFFTSPLCGVCAKVEPLAQAAASQAGVSMTIVDVSTAEGRGMATANSITTTPTIIISGAQSARLVGDVSQAQIAAAIKAAVGTTTPTVTPTPTKTPTAAPTAAPTTTVKQTVATPSTTAKQTTVKQVTEVQTPSKTAVKATKTVVTPVKQPTIEVVTPAETPTTSTQTVPEFSLLGLGAPALAVGAIYLFLRRE